MLLHDCLGQKSLERTDTLTESQLLGNSSHCNKKEKQALNIVLDCVNNCDPIMLEEAGKTTSSVTAFWFILAMETLFVF